ncbi:hypothetical protein D3C80_2062610 [compost metagenome]
MYITGLVFGFGLTHDDYIAFDIILTERGRLSHKSFNGSGMILRQHTGHGIKLRRKGEKGKVIIVR